MTKAVAKKEENLPEAINFEADAGGGFEDTEKGAFAIPFLTVLQAGSPQCKRSDGAYVAGALEGMLFNNVSMEAYDGDNGVDVVSCYFNRTFNEWTPREEGGGLVAVHSVADGEALLATTTKNDKGIDVLGNGNVLTDTRNHYLLLLTPGAPPQPVFMPLSSTQTKESKRWMTVMNGMRVGSAVAPMFSQIYHITTVPKSNDKGSWFVVKIEHKEQITDVAVYEAAKQFRDLVRSGVAKPVEQEGDEDY